jgi:epoxide hydrolase-like predicted phosphatase
MEQRKKRKNNIKALIFDMNGVLILDVELRKRTGISKSFHQDVARRLRLNLDKWFDAIDSSYADSIEGKISEKKTLRIISKNLKIKPKRLEKAVVKTYKKFFKRNKELYRYTYQLKKRGHKIAILSDQWHLSKKALINKKNTKKFNTIILSCDVGIRKPDLRIYKLTLKKLGVKAKESIFIDNREWNIKPAKKLRMKTVLFKNNKQAIREIEKLLK